MTRWSYWCQIHALLAWFSVGMFLVRGLAYQFGAAWSLDDRLRTLVFGIVPLNKICVTPKASIGFHQAYYDKAFTFGIKVTSLEGTSDLMSYYPDTVKDWIRRNGGLTTEMKKIKNGVDLWKIVDPCPEEW